MFNQLSLDITPDMVLRGQGADPAVIARRRPSLFEPVKTALSDGLELLRPHVVYKSLDVKRVTHQAIHFQDGFKLDNKVLLQELASARKVFFVVCTIGDLIDRRVSSLYAVDPVLSLAYDGLGVAAIDALVVETCRIIGESAEAEGLCASIPYSPGMDGWPLQIGQKQIFSVLNPDPEVVRLTSAVQMVPKKSTSMIIGVGEDFDKGRAPCDFCSVRDICRYRSREDALHPAHQI